ncbi:hypothetical protein GYA19_03255 [Candidatus Beckwithbacteria bacterium]|nr:hypothetical protein [Candidatus Beckwithbacteria bacterium]
MVKKLIFPIQHWLLSQGKCVGCARSLDRQQTREKKGNILVYCKCGRIYLKEGQKYRRALFEEI